MDRTQPAIVTAAGREIRITNPDKVLFPTGHTKLDLARYYIAVADGALRGAGGRPNMLKRYPNGIGAEFFYQKRAPESRPDWVEVVTLRFPSGRSADEIVPRDAAALAWMANLACLELHPHPVRAEDVDHPDELRVDLDPVPGVTWIQLREVARVVHAALAEFNSSAGRRHRDRAGFMCRCASSRGGRSRRFDEPRWPWPARSNGGRRPSPRASGGRKNGTACFWTTTRTRKIAPSHRRTPVRPTADARVSAPVTWEELDVCQPEDFTLATMIGRFAQVGDRHAGIDASAGSIDGLLELSARHEREGVGDAPWPPHYRKQRGEPPRVSPSRAAPAKDGGAPNAGPRRKPARAQKAL